MYECNCNDEIWLDENVNTCNIFISWRMMISKREFFEKIFITRCKFFLDEFRVYPVSASLFKGKIFFFRSVGAWPFVWKYSLISGTR